MVFTYVVERTKAGSAKMMLPNQIKKIVAATTTFDVLTRKGHTIALYLQIGSKFSMVVYFRLLPQQD